MGGYPRAISRVRVVVDYANFQLCYRISWQKLKHSQNCFGLLIRGPNRLLSAKVLGLQLWRLLVCAINNYTNTVSVYSMTTLTPCMHSQQLCWRVVNDYVSKCLWSQRLPRHSIFEQYKKITFSRFKLRAISCRQLGFEPMWEHGWKKPPGLDSRQSS